HLEFVLDLKHPEGEGWKWHVGGSMDVRLPGLPQQRLAADGSNGRFAFSLTPASPLTWTVPDLLELSLGRIALTLAQDANTKTYGWKLESQSSLKVAVLPRLSGTLGLYDEPGRRGFAFTADPKQEPLTVTLPLVPGDDRFSVGGSLLLEAFSLLKKQEWELSLTNQLTLVVPKPSSPGSEDPLDQALTLLNDLVGRPVTATLTATRSGVHLVASGLPRVPVPVPVLVNGQVTWDHLGKVGVDTLDVCLGSSASAAATLVLELPEEINNVFGEENGRPKVKLLNREFKLGMSIDSKLGLGLELGSSPLNLEAAGCFKKEVEEGKDGRREWTRFELSGASFRFGELADPQKPAEKWWHVDFGTFGELRFLKPSLRFNGADFTASGGFHVVRDVRLPTAPARWLLQRMGLDALATALPDSIAPLDIHVLEKDPGVEGGKRFNASAFMDTLKWLNDELKLGLPVEGLRPVVSALAGQFNRLPADFSEYLDFDIPRRFEFSLAVTPGTGFGVRLDVRAPENPLKLLLPTGTGFQGLTLRKLSFGETLGGNLLVADMDLELDQFDFVSLAASLFLPPHLADPFTHSRAIQQKLILKNVFWIIIYHTQIPIPIPVWFTEVGFRYYGLVGLRSQLSIRNNVEELNVARLLKGALDLYRELKVFFTQEDRLLPGNLFSRNGMNLGVHVRPGLVQLPKYVGSRQFGTDGELFRLGVDELLVPVVNFLKKPDLGKLLALVPLKHRNDAVGTDGDFAIGPFHLQAAWLFSTRQELDRLVQRREEEPSHFVRYLYSHGDTRGSEFVQALRTVASEATDGRPHEGVILYLMGGVALPVASSGVNGFVGLLADREKGLLGQFRFSGNVGGDVLALDVGGRLAIAHQPAGGDGRPSVDLALAGHVKLLVLGHETLSATVALANGVFTFEDALSLFPPGSGFQADLRVKGSIAREALLVTGEGDIALPPLPAAKAALRMTYERVLLTTSWLGQDWALELARQGTSQYRFTALAARPVHLLPDVLVLSRADDDKAGPVLVLTGPATPALGLSGMLSVPPLSASAGGTVTLLPGRVDASFDAKFLGRYQAHLELHGVAIDKPSSFTFLAKLKGDVLADLAKSLHDQFDGILKDARSAMDQAEQLFQQQWERFTRLVNEGANAIRAGL
ncbi:MAG: hypothetical protein ACXU86_08325, partial [Archangium sp.]